MTDAALVVASYLLGSFPSAYLAVKLLAKRDIRKVGSGNVGGMNAARNVGLPAGLATAALDVGKGALAVYLGQTLSPTPWLPMLCALAAVAGHNWMLFLGLRGGGKGLGASAGAMLLLLPMSIVIVVPLIAGFALLFRNTYMGVVVAFVLLPAILYWLGPGPSWALFGAALAVIVIVKHAVNVRDYLAGARGLT